MIMREVLVAFEADTIRRSAIFFDNVNGRCGVDYLALIVPIERIGIDDRPRIADNMDVAVSRHVVIRGVDFRSVGSQNARMDALSIVKIDFYSAIEQRIMLYIECLYTSGMKNCPKQSVR